MGQLIQSAVDCCTSCTEATVVNTPGAAGADGAAGAAGTDGISAYTTVSLAFVMPALAGDETVTVAQNAWAVVGEIVVLGKFGDAAFAYMRVKQLVGTTQLVLTNISAGAGSTDAYNTNSAPGTIFPIGVTIGPSGLQGVPGAAGTSGADADAKYLVKDATDAPVNAIIMSTLGTGLMKNTTATGATSIVNIGIAAGNAALVDAGGALTAGQAVFAVAAGLESKTAANARTALGAAASGLATASGLTSSAVDKLIGRSTSPIGTGALEEIACTALGRSIIAAVTAGAVYTILGTPPAIVATKIADYQVLADLVDVILCDATAGAIIVTLPAAAGQSGRRITVKKIDATANTVTIKGPGAEKVEFLATQVIASQGTALDMVCNATDWFII